MKIWADVFMEIKHATAFFTARRVVDDLSPTRKLRVTSVAPLESAISFSSFSEDGKRGQLTPLKRYLGSDEVPALHFPPKHWT